MEIPDSRMTLSHARLGNQASESSARVKASIQCRHSRSTHWITTRMIANVLGVTIVNRWFLEYGPDFKQTIHGRMT